MQKKSYLYKKDLASSSSKEHLDGESEEKPEIKKLLKQSLQCENVCNLDNFEIFNECQTDQEAKINEFFLNKTNYL